MDKLRKIKNWARKFFCSHTFAFDYDKCEVDEDEKEKRYINCYKCTKCGKVVEKIVYIRKKMNNEH